MGGEAKQVPQLLVGKKVNATVPWKDPIDGYEKHLFDIEYDIILHVRTEMPKDTPTQRPAAVRFCRSLRRTATVFQMASIAWIASKVSVCSIMPGRGRFSI